MNDEHRQMLRQGLDNLIAAQSEVMEARNHGKGDYQERGEAIERRERTEKGIMDFVESLIEDVDDPLFGTLVYDDPRAGLRARVAGEKGSAYFHGHYTDADGDECALVEYPDGTTGEVYWHKIQFADVGEMDEQESKQ